MREETIKGNGRLKVSRKIIDLIKGLKTLNDLDDCYWWLKNLGILARLIDDIASDDVQYDMPNVSIATLTFYQEGLIDKIENIIEAQDCTIRALHSIIYKAEEAAGIPFQNKDLNVNERKFTALKSLVNVFDPEFGVSVSHYEGLKSWALTYDIDFEIAKKLIGAKEVSRAQE